MSSIGMQLMAAVLTQGSVHDFSSINEGFLKPSEKEVYTYIEEFVIQYGSFPKVSTILKDTGLGLPEAPEPPEYYSHKLEARFLQTEINSTMMAVQQAIHEGEPHAAMELLMDASSRMLQDNSGIELVDFRDAQAMLKLAWKKKQMTSFSGMHSGWNYLDIRMGGLEPGDLLSIVGRPAQGKTFLLLKMAYHAWSEQGFVPLIVTPEMKPIKLVERLAAMHTKSPLTPIAHATYSSKKFDQMVTQKTVDLGTKEQPLWIVDGAQCSTIEDLHMLCRQLQPTALFYDGAYLMKSKNKKLSKWERIAESALSIKYLISLMGIPGVASYQFNKTSTKKKGNEQPGLEDIYGSDEISQLSSIVIGLLDDEDVASVMKKTARLLKGRGGERGQWDIYWDFLHMNFDEIIPPKPDKDGKGEKKVMLM